VVAVAQELLVFLVLVIMPQMVALELPLQYLAQSPLMLVVVLAILVVLVVLAVEVVMVLLELQTRVAAQVEMQVAPAVLAS
jgi:Tfp pilus assembly protein PilX